ncbi:MAG: GNAT family N-acetyltransferase [Gemmatimonadota bacterium]
MTTANENAVAIERLALPASEADLRRLADLLMDAVMSGAAVSFMDSLTNERAMAWWRDTTTNASSRAIFLVARDAEGIVASVQVHPAWAPNQPDRGDLVKLLVHRRARGSGLGTALMRKIEEEARRSGYRLLTLDVKAGSVAEELYRKVGWTYVGTIPRYAYDPDGTPHGASIYYRELT